MDAVDFRDKWVLRRTQRAGLCYLRCKYSNNRIVFIVSDPDFPNKFNIEVRYTAHGRKNRKSGNANYRVLDSRTKTYQFETIEEAFRDANRLMDSWNSPEGIGIARRVRICRMLMLSIHRLCGLQLRIQLTLRFKNSIIIAFQ